KPLKQATSQNRKPGKSDPLEKYLFHKAEFNIKDETTLDLFEEFLRKSGDCSLECSCKIEEYSIHPCRFNIWYENKRQVDNLNLIFDFISKTKEQEKVSLDLSLIKTFLDKLDLNKVVQIITGIDLRANTKESRLKLWLIIKNYPEKVKQITSFINHPLLSELTFSNELLFGIDIYLDGRTCLKAYPLILEDTLKDDLNRKTLKEMFGETTLRLLETCDRTHISFRSESTKRNLHFHPYNAEKFIESINNEKIKLLSEQVTSSGHKIKILSFSEEEMEKNNIRNINIYY
ncbi:MAG: LynF/TruF/PatF family peptide O-prenyltransferase, partial [Nanoarchaeota archaeon]|nr:LynF/TruF/PatF family peptide O-prenyltransferase [Nanoarchaeota archaeon]